MTEDREQAWADLEARAQRLLEHPKDLEPREPIRRYGSLLRLWHFPAYGPQVTWTILTPGKKTATDASPMVREVTWDRTVDDLRVFDPKRKPDADLGRPSLRVRDAALPADELRRHMDAGAGLAVPVFLRAHSTGLDGEYFGLETYETSPFVRLQWWKDGPPEWRHFTDWAAGVRKFLMSLLR